MEFVNPGFLYALFALSIPVVIHLFNFRRFKKVYFTNVDFIRELKQQTQKQSKLKHLLVLLLRLLAITAIVLAFAQPFIPLDDAQIPAQQKNYVQVYIDNSFSMQTGAEGGSLFEEAKKKATDLVEGYSESDRFNLLTNDFEGKNQRFVSKDEFLTLVNETELSSNVKDFNEVLSRFASARGQENAVSSTQFLISDFQKSFLPEKTNLSDSLNRLLFVPVQTSQPGNLSIDSCWMETPVIQMGQLVKLKARITNYSENNYEKIPLRLTVKGKPRSVVTFDVVAGESAVVEIPFTLNNFGLIQGTLTIEDHPVSFDDDMFFSFGVAKVIDVLAINGDEPNVYLQRIFDLDTTFQFLNQDEKGIDYSNLLTHDLIILNELNDISSGLSDQLAEYLKNGGTLILLPSSKNLIASVNKFLGKFVPAGFFATDSSEYELRDLDPNNPVFSNVFEEIPERISMPKVFKHYPLQFSTRSIINRILSLQNGNSFLSEVAVGKGSLYVFSVPFQPVYSNFQNHALFVPVMFNLAISGQHIKELYYIIGRNEVINIDPLPIAADKVLRIQSESGDFEMIPGQLQAVDGITLSTYGDIKQAGNYYISRGDSLLQGISYNYDRRESDLQVTNTGELAEYITKKDFKNSSVLQTDEKPFAAAVQEINRGIEMWKWFVLAALIFLLLEVILLRFTK